MKEATLSQRVRALPRSGVRALMPLAQAAEAQGVRVIYLNVGQPDVETPGEFWQAVRSFPERTLAYADTRGRSELLDALVAYYAGLGTPIDRSQLIVTVSGSEALLLALLVCTDPGDEIVVPEPFFTNYTNLAVMTGTRLVPFPTRAREGYHLPERAAIEARVTARARAILYSSPGNPTGAVYTPEEVARLGRVAADHGLYLLADEVYREFVFSGGPAFSALQLAGLEEHVVVLDSLSKRYSLCGARVGCLVSRNPTFMQAALQAAMWRLSSPTLEQIGAAACVQAAPELFGAILREFTARRDAVYETLRGVDGILCPQPEGAFYALITLQGVDAAGFSRWLLSDFPRLAPAAGLPAGTTVVLTPAADFYATPGAGRDQVRIALVYDPPTLRQAMEIVVGGLRLYRDAKGDA